MNVQYYNDIMEITMKDELILSMVETKYLNVCIHQHHNVRNMLSMTLLMTNVTTEIAIAMMKEQD